MDPGNALVTGASGLVGARLRAELESAGWRVRALLRRRASDAVEGIEADLSRRLPDGVCDGIDVVFHTAALLEGSAAELRAVNLDGTARLLDAARGSGVRRFVHVSTCAVYRDGPLRRARESAPRGGGSPYAKTKQAAEDRVLGAAAELEVVVVRPGIVYGPRDRHFLPTLERLVRECSFPRPASGFAAHSMIHATDCARGLSAAGAAKLASPSCFNLAGPCDVDAGEALRCAARRTGVDLELFDWPDRLPTGPEPPARWWRLAAGARRPPIPWRFVPALATERTLDASAASRALAFVPSIRFTETVRSSGPPSPSRGRDGTTSS